MKKVWKYVGIVAAVAILGLVTVGAVAFAQGPVGDSDQPFNFVERFRQTVAAILGISVEEYDSAVEQAQEQVLTDAVTEGWLTQEQAERMRQRVEQAPGAMPWGMGRGFGGPARGMVGCGTSLVSVAADELGMSQSDLFSRLREGKSIADVANEQGVDPQAIADAYLAQLAENLNQAVEEGHMTQKQADWMLEQAQGQVLDQINGAWENFGRGGLRGGHGGGRFWGFPNEDES